ncbi:hypothetical protein HDV01_000678 [Terramyces sp. JEL0728]|nr:hypothetical protein HDV01_000678 [Terramyces sp. JEL0728]
MKILNFLIAASCVWTYGSIGHSLSGRVAQELLSPKATELVTKLLPKQKGQLKDVASWADQIKSNRKYDWAKPLHYVNPVNDDPPTLCTYTGIPQDCPNDVCVIAAIHNYTNRLLDSNDQEEALKFLVHFIGDIHQPLHSTGKFRGGTQAQVRYNGKLTNLHSLWDSTLFQQRIRSDFKNSPDLYAEYIVKQIGTTWRAEVPEWLACPETTSVLNLQNNLLGFSCLNGNCPSKNGLENLVCPEVWAKYANQINCDVTFKGYKRRANLPADYYKDSIAVEEKMLAQAGVRMAAILDEIANRVQL